MIKIYVQFSGDDYIDATILYLKLSARRYIRTNVCTDRIVSFAFGMPKKMFSFPLLY